MAANIHPAEEASKLKVKVRKLEDENKYLRACIKRLEGECRLLAEDGVKQRARIAQMEKENQ